MTDGNEPTPLEPQRFFAAAWEGEGEFEPARWLARLPVPRRLRFRSFTTMLSDDFWVVHDETRWDDGRVDRRDGLCRRLGPDRLRLTYDDMLGGTEVRLHERGYDLLPYTLLAPMAPLPFRVPVRCRDTCSLTSDGTLVDIIEMSVLGVPIGRQVMRLTREQ